MSPVDLVFTSTFMYPVYGLVYFLSYPELWPFYLTILVPQILIVLTTYILVMMFLFPIIGFLSVLLHGPMAIASVWFVITQLSISISNVIVLKMLMPEIEKLCFESVLSKEFKSDIVIMGKLRRIEKAPFLVKFRSYIWSLPSGLILPFLVLRGLLVFIISFIPVFGPLIMIYIKAPTRALQSHQRYFAMKGFNNDQIKIFFKARKGEYIAFGLMANLLESIPILNLLFMFTNTIGAALWTVNLEKQLKINELNENEPKNNSIDDSKANLMIRKSEQCFDRNLFSTD